MTTVQRASRQRRHLHLHQRARQALGHSALDNQPDSHAPMGLDPQSRESTPSTPQGPSPVELVRRATSTCTDTSSQGCRTGSSAPPASVAIGLGVAIPLVCAFIVFFFLHRRHVKKLRREDLNDPHKSLDFGVDMAGPKPKKGQQPKSGQEMTATSDANLARSLRGGRGMSMDIGSPYLLPPEIQNSQESLHSLSRTMTHGTHDPYLPANSVGRDSASLQSYRMREDGSSIRTGSTRQAYRQDGMQQNLLRNASRISQGDMPVVSSPDSMARSDAPPGQAFSPPPPAASPPGQAISSPPELAPSAPYTLSRKPVPPIQEETLLSPPEPVAGPRESQQSTDLNALRKSNNYLGAIIHSREGSIHGAESNTSPDQTVHPTEAAAAPHSTQGADAPPVLPTISIEQDQTLSSQEPEAEAEPYDVNDLFGPPTDGNDSPPELIADASPRTEDSSFHTPLETPSGLGVTGLDVDLTNSRPLSIVRPLPPEDPNDNPEQRANRIRSFYREYFDDNAPARAYKAGSADYYEDYGQEYLGDGAIFDPATGKFIVAGAQRPYAEPVTRRAMTPPPRGPPRFAPGPRNRHGPNQSMGGPTPRARAFSSASTGRVAGPRGRAPKRPMPPPSALRTLPTPHLLKEDAFTLSIDFAPPPNFRDQQAGRPQSPLGEKRPYSPAVPIASPLASSFSGLSAMPSPHHLRKSGTFTALDFAPPPRFRGDGASDAGSIRSGRSNHSAMSAAAAHSVRAGAYRVSRIPKGLVGTKGEFAEALKPTWKVGS